MPRSFRAHGAAQRHSNGHGPWGVLALLAGGSITPRQPRRRKKSWPPHHPQPPRPRRDRRRILISLYPGPETTPDGKFCLFFWFFGDIWFSRGNRPIWRLSSYFTGVCAPGNTYFLWCCVRSKEVLLLRALGGAPPIFNAQEGVSSHHRPRPQQSHDQAPRAHRRPPHGSR